ncbi:MAG TPA: flagellar hook-basal body complex protein FliE [Gemmatimonadales bacterium]|nr:flagellar hook-basal body complex protein FliE [Gemmatimonadales bacterium]
MADPISGSIGRIAAAALPRTDGSAAGVSAGGPSFADTLKEALGDVSRLQTDAQDTINAFLTGQPVELHQVMAATEEASLSLELLVEVRNKLADAYRSIMNMQG